MNNGNRHWLDDARNVDRTCYALYVLSALLMLADLLYQRESHFAVDGWFGFYGFFGLVSCIVLILAVRLLRRILRRGEDYYDPEKEDHAR